MSLFSDINEVELLGNVASDPELRYTLSGTAVAKLTVATNRSYEQGDEWKTDVDYHNVVLWARLAEHANERLQKGSRVLIKGRLQTRSWEDKESGKMMYRTEIIANEMILIDRYKTKNGDQVNKGNKQQEDVELVDDIDIVDEITNIDINSLPF